MPDVDEIQTPLTATPEPDPAVKRGPGRPPKAVQAQREPIREPVREPSYRDNGRAQVQGRDGELLTRKRTTNNDLFHVPSEIIPDGWDYQWNVSEVLGQPQTAQMLAMAENGWRPVPAGRHRGMFMPASWPESGEIVRDGLRLEERPLVLSEEARAEEHAKAGKLMRDQQEQLGLAQRMPDGFSRDNPNLRRMERSGTSRSFAPAPDAPRPRLEIDPT